MVKKLRAAGAIILAKLNMSEFASGAALSSLGGQTLNPHDLLRSPSGSSGGTGAAVAAAFAAFGLGTDTGGSVRGPSSANGIVGQEGWFYPKYIEAKCPGLPEWEALKSCGELFSTAETAPKGRVVDYPEEWTPDSAKWIEALGLPLQPVPAGGEGALVTEIKSAFARKEPVMVMFWQPHWALLEYDMGVVKFPTWEEPCETDPKWGVNPDKTFDNLDAPGGAVDHVDVYFNAGHPGVEKPHAHLVLWHVGDADEARVAE